MGFIAAGQVLKVPVAGGVPSVVATVRNVTGASWGPDGSIVLGISDSGLRSVPAAGGTPEPLTVFDR